MKNNIKITEIVISPIPPTRKGIVAFVSFVIDNIYKVNDVMLGTSLKRNNYRIIYPIKILPNGASVQVFYPINKKVGDQIQKQVLKEFNKLIKKQFIKY